MSINTISTTLPVSTGNALSTQNATNQTAVNNAITNDTNALTQDYIAQVSAAAQLQSSNSGVQQLASQLSQASGLAETASSGISQIQSALTELESLANQAASPATNSNDLDTLNAQFQQVAATIDQTANSITFDGQQLLNGALNVATASSLKNLPTSDGDDGLTIPPLTTTELFGGQSLSLLSPATAQQAVNAVKDALKQISETQANVANFQTSIDQASVAVETAAFNQQAANSTLTDDDFANSANTLSALQQNTNQALAAQGNLLNPAFLNLVQ